MKAVRVPLTETGSRFTVQFEAFAVAVTAASRSPGQAAELLWLYWNSVQRLIGRAVARGLARLSTVGLRWVWPEEKRFHRGQRYVSLMTDLQQSRVLELVEGRDSAQAMAVWAALPPEQRGLVEAAAMDMGANFVAAHP